MENRYDLNLLRCNLIKHRKRKTPSNDSSESFVNNRIQVGIAADSGNSLTDLFHEFDIQIQPLLGIPLPSFGKFGIRVGSEPKDHSD